MTWAAILMKIRYMMLGRKYRAIPTSDDSDGDDYSNLTYLNMMEDRMGMKVTAGNVKIQKDESNLIGISIGGGAPNCICVYIVQVFDNTPVAREGTLQSGDEILAVNGESVKGRTKVEVAKLIQTAKDEVIITYNKLHADPKQGKTLDIVLKKVKHRIVENMSSSTADALGLSRAILQKDTLVKKLQELERNEYVYKGLVEHTKRMLKAFFDMCQVYRAFGDVFSQIGVREPQPRASEAFTQFGEGHRNMEKFGIRFLKAVKPMLTDLGTYLNKAIPDTKLTIKKYADVKFEYLSYCLKVKEMDEEEYAYQALQEPLYRVETGNYEYRLILRCRQDARTRFLNLRSDVLEKLELLDQKHVQDIVFQMNRLLTALAAYHTECVDLMDSLKVFPIELDLPQTTFEYAGVEAPSKPKPYRDEVEENQGEEEEEEKETTIPVAKEAVEENLVSLDCPGPSVRPKTRMPLKLPSKQKVSDDLLSLDLSSQLSQNFGNLTLLDS